MATPTYRQTVITRKNENDALEVVAVQHQQTARLTPEQLARLRKQQNRQHRYGDPNEYISYGDHPEDRELNR